MNVTLISPLKANWYFSSLKNDQKLLFAGTESAENPFFVEREEHDLKTGPKFLYQSSQNRALQLFDMFNRFSRKKRKANRLATRLCIIFLYVKSKKCCVHKINPGSWSKSCVGWGVGKGQLLKSNGYTKPFREPNYYAEDSTISSEGNTGLSPDGTK